MTTPSSQAGERLLIVNADDFGLTPGVCEAVLVAHERGIVTSTSALVVGPAWDQYASALASSGIGVGAHLCVVGEDPPVLSASEVPTLVNAIGRFPLTWKQFVVRAAMGRVDTADLRREFAAQIERMTQAGVRLTHIDSHQNLHQWPQVSSVLFELAAEHGIGAARVTRSSSWSPPALGVRVLGGRFERACRRAGVVTPAGSTGLDEAGRLSLPTLTAAIARLGQSGVATAEVASHPGLADDPARERYEWGYRWSEEFEALQHPSARAAVESAGFELGDFGDLVTQARRRGDAKA